MQQIDILFISAIISLAVGIGLFIQNCFLRNKIYNLNSELFEALTTVIQLHEELIKINVNIIKSQNELIKNHDNQE
jgi:hypothetical protein